MKKGVMVVLFWGVWFFCFSQNTFQKTFGEPGPDYSYSVELTADSGYIIAGTIHGGTANNYDVYLIKTDSNGDWLWRNTYGGTEEDEGYFVQQTMDGGYIIAGSTRSFGAGLLDLYLLKTDANGNLLWSKTFGGTNHESFPIVQQTTDGGYIIAGQTLSFGGGFNDIYLIKTDTNGDSLWTKTFGGADVDVATCVKQTIDGGYLICGNTISFSTGDNDAYLIKTDVNGYTLWTKTIGGAGDDNGNFVQQTSDGGYIITGTTRSAGAGIGDVYLIKTDTNCDTLWTKTFSGTGADAGSTVEQTNDGGYIIAGSTRSFGATHGDIYLIKTDMNGDMLWTKTFGGSSYEDGSYIVHQAMDGGYIITGYTYSFGEGSYDAYLIKTDADGNSGCNQTSPPTIQSSIAWQISSPATIITSPPTIVTIPATTAFGGGGRTNTLCSILSTNEITIENSFLISPNPATNQFTITSAFAIKEITICNVLGEVVYTVTLSEVEARAHTINAKLTAGIYFVRIATHDFVSVKKLVVN